MCLQCTFYCQINKKGHYIYQQILWIFSNSNVVTTGLNLSPALIMLDFEVSAMNAFRTVLPTASIRCCRFHMGQAMHLKICHLGLTSAYKDDAETGKWLKHFFGLSLLPLDEVGDAFADIMARSHRAKPSLTIYAEHLCRSGQPLSSTFMGVGTHC